MSKKITDLTALTTPDSTDVVPLVDISASTTKKTTVGAIAAQIPSGTVTNAMLSTSAGEPGGAWQSWTPTLVSFVLGNGIMTAKYMKVGKTIFFRIKWIFGSTSSVGASGTFSLPVTAHSDYEYTNGTPNVGVTRYDCSVNLGGYCRLESVSTIRPVWMQTATAEAGITTSSPGTWTTGDTMHLTGMYEAA